MKYLIFNLLLLFSSCQTRPEKSVVSDDWKGVYSLSFVGDRDYSFDMHWEHRFTVSDTCIYEGSGFQYYSKYLCEPKLKGDTLIIIADRNIDGYFPFKEGEVIIKIFKRDSLYYTNTYELMPNEVDKKQFPITVDVEKYRK